MEKKRSACLWVEGKRLDSADASSFDGGDLHVAVLTPVGVPGVSEDIVILSAFGAVSDESDCMVECGSTGDIIEDTSLVVLEHGLVSFNGDSDRLLNDGCLQLRDGVLWYGSIVLDLDNASIELSDASTWHWSRI